MICPSCDGSKESFGFVDGLKDGKHYGYSGWHRCSTCQGTGEITDEHALQREEGKLLRRFRGHEKHLSQRDAGRCWGIDFVLLSKMEAGRVPIPDELWVKAGREKPLL